MIPFYQLFRISAIAFGDSAANKLGYLFLAQLSSVKTKPVFRKIYFRNGTRLTIVKKKAQKDIYKHAEK
jgi:hypothetical protein